MTALSYPGDEAHPYGLFVCDLVPDWALDERYKPDLEFKHANMDFISNSRTDIPRLCKAWREQQAEIERLRGALEHIRAIYIRIGLKGGEAWNYITAALAPRSDEREGQCRSES